MHTARASLCSIMVNTLRWRHNDRDSVSHHQPHDCLLNRLFRRRSKETSKLRVTGRPVNSPHKRPVKRKMFLFDDVIMACRFTRPCGLLHCNHVITQCRWSNLLNRSKCIPWLAITESTTTTKSDVLFDVSLGKLLNCNISWRNTASDVMVTEYVDIEWEP